MLFCQLQGNLRCISTSGVLGDTPLFPLVAQVPVISVTGTDLNTPGPIPWLEGTSVGAELCKSADTAHK